MKNRAKNPKDQQVPTNFDTSKERFLREPIPPRLLYAIRDAPFRTQEQIERLTYPNAIEISDRELCAMQWAARGYSNKLVALEMNVSIETIKSYIQAVINKLGVRNRTEACCVLLREGRIE